MSQTTPESIARRCAESLVTVDYRFGTSGDNGSHQVCVGDLVVLTERKPHWADSFRDDLRAAIGPAFAAAIEEALQTVPVPGPVGDEYLAHAREWFKVDLGLPDAQLTHSELIACKLFAHIAHLSRALHDCGQDGSAAIYTAGYEAGKAAMKADILALTWDQPDYGYYPATYGREDGNPRIAALIKQAIEMVDPTEKAEVPG